MVMFGIVVLGKQPVQLIPARRSAAGYVPVSKFIVIIMGVPRREFVRSSIHRMARFVREQRIACVWPVMPLVLIIVARVARAKAAVLTPTIKILVVPMAAKVNVHQGLAAIRLMVVSSRILMFVLTVRPALRQIPVLLVVRNINVRAAVQRLAMWRVLRRLMRRREMFLPERV